MSYTDADILTQHIRKVINKETSNIQQGYLEAGKVYNINNNRADVYINGSEILTTNIPIIEGLSLKSDDEVWIMRVNFSKVDRFVLCKRFLDDGTVNIRSNGTNRVFMETPIPPYYIGDFWITPGRTNLKVCVTSKEIGTEFSDFDWFLTFSVLGDEAIDQINNSLTNLKQDIDDFSSDGMITLIEAKTLELSLNQVISESSDLLYVSLNDETISFYISMEAENYKNALLELEEELSKWIDEEVYPITITPEERDNISLKFINVQNTKIILMNKIASVRSGISDNSASEAQQEADKANLLLEDIASDNKLTSVEKKNVKVLWDAIVGEKPILIEQAKGYGLVTTDGTGELQVYNDAYDALEAYITPLITGENFNITSDINGEEFRKYFADYYTAKISLLNKISNVLKDIANNASQIASDAQKAADEALAQAEIANALLLDIGSDNSLTISEKITVKREWDLIVAEKENIESQADLYGITTEKENYTNAYISLQSYISPLLANMEITNSINGEEFSSKFSAYYDAKIALLNKIVYSTKEYIDLQLSNFINITYATDKEKMQNQLDSKVENWFTETDPSLNWLTDEEKDWHDGDFWYDKTTGILKHYEDKAWWLIEDPVAISTFLNIARSQGASDLKSTIFTVQPTTPYDIGDMWTQGIDGDIMVCITARSEGEFDETDWKRASKYIDNANLREYVSIAFSSLTGQVDNQYVNWFMDEDPQVNLETRWSSEQDIEHYGDLWYNTTTGVVNRFENTGWVLVEDQNIINALQIASLAKDTVDKKRRVFANIPPDHPSSPYDVGDLWVQGEAGDMFVCTVKNISVGEYNPLHWKKAVKYTDDTLANQAQHAADMALANAINANNAILAIAEDDKLSIAEKPAIKNLWDLIVAEKPILDFQAESCGLSSQNSTEYSTYISLYNNLSTYIIPLLSNMSTDSEIVSETFKAYFANYYDAKVNLLKAIIVAVKDSSIQKDVLYSNGYLFDSSVGGYGVVVTRGDKKIRTTLNASWGIEIQKNSGTPDNPVWYSETDRHSNDIFYVDTDGNLHITGNFTMTGGTISWTNIEKPTYTQEEIDAMGWIPDLSDYITNGQLSNELTNYLTSSDGVLKTQLGQDYLITGKIAANQIATGTLSSMTIDTGTLKGSTVEDILYIGGTNTYGQCHINTATEDGQTVGGIRFQSHKEGCYINWDDNGILALYDDKDLHNPFATIGRNECTGILANVSGTVVAKFA